MTLHSYLTHRLASAYRQLERSLKDLDETEAARGAREDWRRYRHGEGLDGSIRGIVRHVSLWKHVTAQGLETGVFPGADTLSWPEGWSALLAWLAEGNSQMTAALASLTDEQLDETVQWEGRAMTLASIVAHLLEHDHYHAGQINLIRQQNDA
jgi:uncharacterized damage-inducible protein DinB